MGKTVRELKEGMDHEEAMRWGLYRKKYGPFDLQQRMQYQLALLAAIQAGEKKLTKFIPWYVEPEVELTPQAMLAGLRTASTKNRVRANGK